MLIFMMPNCVARILNAAKLRRGNDVQTPLPNLSDQTPGDRFPGFPLLPNALFAQCFVHRRELLLKSGSGTKSVELEARKDLNSRTS